MAILDQMKASTTTSMLMVAAALFLLFGHQRAAAQLNCPSTIANQARNVTRTCFFSSNRLPTCCAAARGFNFSCTCSSPVLNIPRVPSSMTVGALTAAARLCNITLPQGLNCTGVRT